jgi:membrane associated rhomboid family serine protease
VLLPVRIDHPYQRIPYVTNTLLGVAVGVFVLTLGRGDRVFPAFGLNTEDFRVYQPITYLFLHAGLFHLLGNVLFLAVYGRYVEERLGPWRYLVTYLGLGVVAGGVQALSTRGVGVGASGAISGLMGLVLVGAPWAQVRVVPIFGPHLRDSFTIAAFWLVGLWVVTQVVLAAKAPPWSRVGYDAHLSGVLAGGLLAFVLRSPRRKTSGWYLDPSPPGGGPESTRRLRSARRIGHAGVVFHSLEGVSSPVAVIKLLMVRCDLEPEEAKRRLDEVREGRPQRFAFPDEAAAGAFEKDARDLGVRTSP